MLAPLSSARIAWVGNARWITSMIAASDSRSASVTRSIEFDLRLMVILLSRLRWIRPAARAARSATCSISFITIKKSITRGRERPARRADQSTVIESLTAITLHFDQLYAYLPAGVFTAASTGGGVDCAIIRRCAYGMIVVNRSTWLSSDL